jgi:hypothetical protein
MDYEAMMPDETVGMARGGILAFNTGGVGTDKEGEKEARDYMQSQLAQNVSNAPTPVAATAPVKADPKSITSFIEQYKEFLGAIPQGDAYKEQEESYKNAPARAEATKKEDLSMALIQFGLNMAAGKSPRALQNIADAGVKTLPSMQEAYKQRRLTEEAGLKGRAELDRMSRAEQLAALTGGIGLYGKERDITAAAELEEAKHKKALELARLTKEGKTPTDLINFVNDYVTDRIKSGDNRAPETIKIEGYKMYPGYVVKQEATASTASTASTAQNLTAEQLRQQAIDKATDNFSKALGNRKDPIAIESNRLKRLDVENRLKGNPTNLQLEYRNKIITDSANSMTPSSQQRKVVSPPRAETNPIGLPDGARKIGTSGGKAVYETPDGKRFIQN